MKKRQMLLLTLFVGGTVFSTWYWAANRQESMLNDYTNEKYGFDVEVIGDKGEHSDKYTVKRGDKPEYVFTIKVSNNMFSSHVESDNYAESEIIQGFNQQLKNSNESMRLEELGFHHSLITRYYEDSDEENKRMVHDQKTALYLYQDKVMNESDAKRFLDAIPIIESIKEKLAKTGNHLEMVVVFESRYHHTLYENGTEKGTVKFWTKQIESVTSREEARKLIEKGSYN
ncbi:hypothetical protein FGG79_18335 [Bacillus sp. BHET2]|uniref:hypothetical protein n=1 Tax=Bacillus sp. BHET2 TaxID=2583818 RepID=UPI00110F3B10|nr:hypothetical protein [Bacillus sp. BHET2]TMU84093.1 hypothetical protein FGG79_18335 [Bacillus sp. BHET2]